MKFYMTYNRSAPRKIIPYIESNDVPVMCISMDRWSEATDQFKEMWDYDTSVIIDSGGFGVLNNSSSDNPTYPFSVDEYHQWLSTYSDRFEWAAVMDFACEEQFDDIYSVDERIDKTIENTIYHFDKDPDYDLIPVLQGRLIHQYLECYDRLKDHGIPVDRVGLGTVCRVSESDKIAWLENKLRKNTEIEWMHGFGVKITAIKNGVGFESMDSAAWAMPLKFGKYFELKDNTLEQHLGYEEHKEAAYSSFKAYYEYAEEKVFRRPDGKLFRASK